MELYVKTKFAEMWLENEIIHVVHPPKIQITLEIAQECVEERLKLSAGNVYPLFSDLRNIVSVDEDARQYLSQGDAVKYLSAGAFLVGNSVNKLMAATFILFNRPVVPTKFFTNITEALRWLEYHKHIN